MGSAPRFGVTALVLAMLAGPAAADIPVYYHVGSWDAFSGPGSDGRMVCGIGTTNPADNRAFSARFPAGGDAVTFQAKKPTWSIPAGTQLPVVVQVGLNTPWNLQGTGNGQVVEWLLDREAIQAFDAQFRRAGSMTISFPTGNEPPWTVALNGSTAISNAFGRCVTDMTNRAAAQQQPAPAPVPAGPDTAIQRGAGPAAHARTDAATTAAIGGSP